MFVVVSLLLLLQVTREDARLLSAAITFYQLHECCSNKSKPSHPSAVMSLQADQFQASVPMALSSLLPHSQIVGILFTAFSHPSEGEDKERKDAGCYMMKDVCSSADVNQLLANTYIRIWVVLGCHDVATCQFQVRILVIIFFTVSSSLLRSNCF